MIFMIKLMGCIMLTFPFICMVYIISENYPEKSDLKVLTVAGIIYLLMALVALWFGLGWFLATL